MKVDIVAIGNSRGVRLPKALLEQCRFGDAAELTVEDGRLVLTPVAPRAGWRGAFAAAEAADLDDEDRDWLDADLESAP
ncbi:MAG: AbrB/MazE/SpoVT family DNA-binding domain-containing protein [Alphaproteobacteria bacterium]|nr:AbrB/MazE/SpoVT family DNA-binding domain-containing protein [Alphaproteobacteria bacterium]